MNHWMREEHFGSKFYFKYKTYGISRLSAELIMRLYKFNLFQLTNFPVPSPIEICKWSKNWNVTVIENTHHMKKKCNELGNGRTKCHLCNVHMYIIYIVTKKKKMIWRLSSK